jgi:hypothetical protein
MKRFMIVLCVVALASGIASTSMASVTIEVIPSLAPNGWGSPSFAGYESNAVYAIEHGLSAYGDPTSPTYYQAAPSVLPISANIVTGFASWLGQANPTGAFAGEEGNRLHFGVHILGNGTKFSISQLYFSATSGDADNTLGFGYDGGYEYGTGYVGIIYGTNGGPNTYITSGSSDQFVDELVGRGSGNAWDAYDISPGATLQDKIDRIANGTWNDTSWGTDLAGPDAPLGPNPFDFTGTYGLFHIDEGGTGSASVEFNVPEPATMIVWGVLGLIAVAHGVSRRKRTA